jgi:DNA-binding winged helix-turn-helix (wHTH) protein
LSYIIARNSPDGSVGLRHIKPMNQDVFEKSFQLADWQIMPDRNLLQRRGKSVTLEPRVMDVLLSLAAHGNVTVTREQLIAFVWPGVHVVDGVLARSIYQLRKAFGPDTAMIETIRGRGYRLRHVPVMSTEPTTSSGWSRAASGFRLREMVAASIALAAIFLIFEARMDPAFTPSTVLEPRLASVGAALPSDLLQERLDNHEALRAERRRNVAALEAERRRGRAKMGQH